eukprot:CAMPEP_0117571814 /NCGR_PEP_ID=MMETSP0784-20121206/59977_1 /TAXON_ID=39447 /ORGANISM="" /LENGTH=269 /DNA_ID=CAMNT_0005370049 /DNA_START=44 /DNA_END=850 /DNA_ORIENTATION=+
MTRNMIESLKCILAAPTGPTKDSRSTGPMIQVVRFNAPFLSDFKERHRHCPSGAKHCDTVRTTKANMQIRIAANTSTKCDVLVLATGHWLQHPAEKIVLAGGAVAPKTVEGLMAAFRNELWAARRHLEKAKFAGLVVYRSYSPRHYGNGDWNSGGECSCSMPPPSGVLQTIASKGNCEFWVQPRKSSVDCKRSGLFGSMATEMSLFTAVAAATWEGTKLGKFAFLNISSLSYARPDAHPGSSCGNAAIQGHVPDCSHYCVPGVPDTWND